MNPPNLTNKQLRELDSLFELVSQRQTKDFGNISASNKADGSLLTSCDLWSDKTIVDGLASIAPGEGVLSEEGQKLIPSSKAYWVVDPLDGTTNFAAGIPYWSISVARFVDGKPQSSFLIIPTLKKKFVSIKGKGVWLNNKKIDPSQINRQSECISLCSRSIKILQKKPNSVFPGKIRLLGVSSLNLKLNEEKIISSLKEIESSKESVRLSRLRYDVGISTLKDVLVRQNELSNAKSKNINAIYNYNLNIDELERLTFLDKSKNCLVSNNTKIEDTESICNL